MVPPLAIEIQALTKRFKNGVLANDAIDLDVPAGAIFGLLGPNAAGKTTLVRQLTGDLVPSSGRVHVLGVDVLREPNAAKRLMGIVPQEADVFMALTPEEHLRLFGQLRGLSRAGAGARAEELLGLLDLWEHRKKRSLHLSGGLKRKLLVGMAIVASPRVLVLDEPTTGLDPHARRQVWALIRALQDGGASVLLTTHNMEEAEAICSSVAILSGVQCVSCHGYFYETHGTIFHGKRSSADLIVRVMACLAEGLGIRGTARVFEIDPNTVLSWLVEAAEQLKALSAYFLHGLHINQIQLDELYAVLSAVRDGDMSEAAAIEQLSQSPHWVWTAIDPETKLLLSAQVGARTLAMAQAMLHHLVQVLAPGCMPLLLSDGYPHYLTAIVTHFGHWVQPPRRQAKGNTPKPRWMPLPALLYAQVVKTLRRRRIVEVKHRVVFGTKAAVEQVLAAWGWQINTSFVERLNLSLRQRVAAMGRRSATSCKSEDGLGQQLALFQVYHNFVLPHASLRQPLAEPVRTNGKGSAKVWWPCTPAMAAGLTDHVWTLKEVLLFRVPPWPQPKSSNGLARKMIITQRGTGMPTSRQGGVNETLKTGLET